LKKSNRIHLNFLLKKRETGHRGKKCLNMIYRIKGLPGFNNTMAAGDLLCLCLALFA
jgi:hypothetical protein